MYILSKKKNGEMQTENFDQNQNEIPLVEPELNRSLRISLGENGEQRLKLENWGERGTKAGIDWCATHTWRGGTRNRLVVVRGVAGPPLFFFAWIWKLKLSTDEETKSGFGVYYFIIFTSGGKVKRGGTLNP